MSGLDVSSGGRGNLPSLSAVGQVTFSRGLEALIGTLPPDIQSSVRQYAIDRLCAEAQKRVVLEKLAHEHTSGTLDALASTIPEMLISINASIAENDFKIRKAAGTSATVVLDALKDPSMLAPIVESVRSGMAASASGSDNNNKIGSSLGVAVPTRSSPQRPSPVRGERTGEEAAAHLSGNNNTAPATTSPGKSSPSHGDRPEDDSINALLARARQLIGEHAPGDAVPMASSPFVARPDSPINTANFANTVGSRLSKRRGSGDGVSVVSGKTNKTAATSFVLDTSTLLSMPRHTLSAKSAASKSRGMDAILNTFPKMKQYAVREMARDIAELVVRRETVEARIAEDPLYSPDAPPPKVLLELEASIDERIRRLVKLAGEAGAEMVLSALNDPSTREAMGFSIDDEDTIREETGDEAQARIWRRKLEAKNVQPLRGVRGENAAATHDDATNTGGRDLFNQLNRRDPEETLSYYQKQQLKYGRGRRGSTSIAGAWETLFGGDVRDGGGGDTGTVIVTQMGGKPVVGSPPLSSPRLPSPSRARSVGRTALTMPSFSARARSPLSRLPSPHHSLNTSSPLTSSREHVSPVAAAQAAIASGSLNDLAAITMQLAKQLEALQASRC